MAPLRLGVVGCGRIAQVAHLPAIMKASGVELAAVSDPSPTLSSGVSRRYGVAGFTDTAELLAQPIDAVVLAVPDRLHVPLGVQALRAGKHLLVEKPAADTSRGAAHLAELAAETSRKLQVGAMRRHDPGLGYARAAMPEIGEVLSVSCWYRIPARLRPSTEAALFPPVVVDEDVRTRESTFKADRERYLLYTHGAHVFDTLRYLVGDIAAVRARVVASGRDFYWHGTGRLADPQGLQRGLVSFEISADVHADYAEGMEIFGSLGHVSIRSAFPFFREATRVGVYVESTGESRGPVLGGIDPYQRQVEAFAEAVAADTGTTPDGWDGVAALRLIEAVADSAAGDGKEVTL